ncbi:amino acid adenylation domain-containing protein [Paraneptunicella aestuarii]|uniref:non-ribosomal peptide synthetase n=1 Tax=Paraneptunicella aestuarii TaxID=2831148 RepID=UPI001E2EE7B1|nr:non-ribosomal peptide synthetase [Paraneptunicella aestuarii]UAA37208.1 amino acid adenylation domain-containing protein [Paraneptunicella aestuarii]
MSINALVHEGQLRVDMTGAPRCRDIERLGVLFEQSLAACIAHCESSEGQFTPSDFALAAVDMATLSGWQADYPGLEKLYVATPMQSGLLFHGLLDGSGASYTIQIGCELSGRVDSEAMRGAWEALVGRYDILRTAFVGLDGEQPHQLVQRTVDLPFIQLDWREKSFDEQVLELERLLREDKAQGFDFGCAPLMRIHLIRMGEERYRFVWTYHHALLDGWCTPILFGEVLNHYHAQVSGEAELSSGAVVPYEHYIGWLLSRERQLAADFWQGHLSGFVSPTPLLYDRVSGDGDSVGYQRLSLDEALTGRLMALARAHHTTMNVVLQAAWSCLLQRYSNEQDIVFGSTISGRPAELPGVEQMIGLFINTIPVRVQVEPQMSFGDLLGVLHADNIERDEYGYLPLAQIQQLSEVSGGTSLFDSLLVFENYPMDAALNEAVASRSNSLEISDVHSFEHTNYPLAVRAYVHQDQLQCELTYQAQHFTLESIERICQHLKITLSGMADSDAQVLVSELPILSDAEQKAWLDTPVTTYPVENCVHQVFELQVEQEPDRTALICEDKKLSYDTLNKRANQLAHHLISMGVKPDSLIGLCVERSIETVVATLAILKSGAAYVPMDPNYPKERLDYLFSDSQVDILITQTGLAERFAESEVQLVCLQDPQVEATLEEYSDINPEVTGLTPEHMAYVIYTSGSTGQPKGVMVEHQNVARLFTACNENFEFGHDDVWTLFHSNAFDFSVWEMWGALLHGGTVVVVPSQVAQDNVAFSRLLKEHKVTVLSQTPSAFYPLVEYLCDYKDSLSLRYIVFGGEALEYGKLKHWFSNMEQSPVQLVNMYGITETTVHVTHHAVCAQDAEKYSSNIGRPLADLRAYVCSTQMALQPVGVTGELYVSGAGVARGYLNRPELTAERFIEHSFDNSEKQRLYRTGDLVRWNVKGQLEYVGRIDDQVKIRGFRIELGEIESALVAEGSVKNAAVVAFNNAYGDQQLAAYVVPAIQTPEEVEYIRHLKNYLISKLPQHMVPGHYYVLDDLPLTSNGKLNRKVLPYPAANALSQREYVAPRNELENRLSDLWKEILELEEVGVNDNFFELGGHSLHAMRLVSQIRKTFDVDIALSAILRFPTISACAEEITSLQNGIVTPQILRVAEDEDIPLSFGQQRLWFVDQLQGGSTQYNISVAIRLEGNLQPALVEKVFDTILHRHEVLRTCIIEQDGKATPIVKADFELPIFWQDLSDLDSDTQQATLKMGMVEDATDKYDLSTDLPVRLKVFKLAEEQFVFLFNTHHIASDGSSMQVLIDEFSKLYAAYNRGEQNPLPPLEVQYGDFSYWQRNWLKGKNLESEMDFWKGRLAGIPSVHSLPLDKPRPAVQQFDGAFFNDVLDPKISQQIIDFCAQNGVTQFAFLQTAFALLMSRYSHQNDIVMSTAISGRTQSEIEPLIGFFVNDLVLRSDLSDGKDFMQLLEQNKNMLMEAFDHQHIPFQLLVEELQPERSMSHSPIAQIKFDFQEAEDKSLDIEGLKLTYLKDENLGNIDYDLHLNVSLINGLFSLSWRYSSALFVEETLSRMSANFSTLLSGILAHPEQSFATLPILSDSELRRVTEEFNRNDRHISESLCAHQLIEQMAELSPDKTALYFDGETLTYEELNEQANQVAHYLISQGVEPDTLVALYVERSLDMIIGILGILKAGGAYVPIDPDLPDSRVEYILENSECEIVLTQTDLMSSLPMDELKVLPIDENMREALLASQPVTNIPVQECNLTSRNLAYVIYTSGSTGQPKGVMLEHQGVVNLARSQNEIFKISADSNILQFASISFDASVSEWVTALSAGATLSILEDEKRYDIQSICEFVETQGVTHATIPPALFHQERAGRAKSLQVLVFAGEKLSGGAISKAQQCFPNAQFINAYGPTENTVCTSAETLDETLSTDLIGYPMNNVYCCVMDQAGNLCPIGAEGELLVGGTGLARGYVNQPELTQEKFINIDDANIPYQRLYKTGDLVKWNADGKLIFVGRVDQQVKLRGFRIELEEISSALSEHPQVDKGVVNLVEVQPGDKRLVAYCKPQNKVELWPSISEFFIYDYFAYRAMFMHIKRNELYRKALEKNVVNKTVLDIGPGPEAILSRLCLESGAKHVYAVEILEETYLQAKQYIELAGLTDRITLIHGDIMEVELPEKADFCVSEIVGSIAGSEGSAVLIESARRLLKDPANMIPVKSVTRIAAATLEESQFDYGYSGLAYQYAERILDDFGKDFQYRISVKNVTDEIVISSRDVFEDLDYQNGSPFELDHDICLNINKKSIFNGLLVWMDLFVDHDLNLDILDDPASWLPVYFPVSCSGIDVDVGDYIEATISRRLCDNGVNPDFHVEGKLIRKNGEEFNFKFDSFHHAHSDIESPFHQKLFDENGQLNKLEEFSVTQLKRYLSDKLPHYMVPSDFVILDDIPLTHNGKVDYQALPEVDLNTVKETVYVAPETEEEHKLCAIWQQVLSLEDVGVEDNFFDIGGHSLLAASVVSLVRDAFGVEVPLRMLFEKPTIREFVTLLSQFADNVVMPPIEVASRDETLPLSFAQQRLWFIDQLENSNQYHIQASFELHGELVTEAFEQALSTIVQRHEVLRSGIEKRDELPVLVIHEQVALPVTRVDLCHLSLDAQEQEIRRLVALDSKTPFDLSRPPLLRLHLIQCDSQRHVVLSSMHIASDGWSMGILVKELNTLYGAYCQGQPDPLPALTVQYADYARWQREWLQGDVLGQQLDYWKTQLDSAPQVHSLPLDKPRPKQQQYQGKVLTRKLSVDDTRQLQLVCQAQDVTLFMLMQTAFAVLLSRFSGETDIVIGSPSSGRVHKDLEGLIGFFINALPLRSDVSGNPPFVELLQQNRQMILEAFEHQHIPFDMLVEEVKPQRSMAYAPLAQIYFTMQNNAVQSLELEQLDLQGRGAEISVIRYDLEFDMFVANEQLVIDWKYNTALFEEETLVRMADSFEQMLSGIVQDIQTPVEFLPLLTAEQQETLLYGWNDTEVEIDLVGGVNRGYLQAFENQVAKTRMPSR